MKTNPHGMEARMGNALLEMVILATGLPRRGDSTRVTDAHGSTRKNSRDFNDG
jgi:hypothetical protein